MGIRYKQFTGLNTSFLFLFQVQARDNDYQDYVNFIRNYTGYNAASLNAFVREMINAKVSKTGIGNINA